MDEHKCWGLGPPDEKKGCMAVAFTMHDARMKDALEFASFLGQQLQEDVAIVELMECVHDTNQIKAEATIVRYHQGGGQDVLPGEAFN